MVNMKCNNCGHEADLNEDGLCEGCSEFDPGE